MGLFENKEEKNEEKMQKLLEKYHLLGLPDKYLDGVKSISMELAGSGLSEFGSLLTMGTKADDKVKMQYLNALVQQNWIIIGLLNDIRNK